MLIIVYGLHRTLIYQHAAENRDAAIVDQLSQLIGAKRLSTGR